MPKILLGISSSIAFYKAFTLYKKLLENGFEVKIVLTKGVQKMIQKKFIISQGNPPLAPQGGNNEILNPQGGNNEILNPQGGNNEAVAPYGNNEILNPQGGSGEIVTKKLQDIPKIFLNQNGDVLFESLVLKKGREVFYDLFEEGICWQEYLNNQRPIPHINLADWADLILIAPATANVIGKIANGIYDDLLTNIVSATTASVWLAPAMNVKMWQNSIVRENVQKLQKHAFTLIPPEEGSLACGYSGVGRLADISVILEKVLQEFRVGLNPPLAPQGGNNEILNPQGGNNEILNPQGGNNEILKLQGGNNVAFQMGDNSLEIQRENFSMQTVLITVGATVEKLDAVRVITNQSSGKTGLALAREFLKKGFKVILLASKNIDSAVYLDYLQVDKNPPLPPRGGNNEILNPQGGNNEILNLQGGNNNQNLSIEYFTDYESLQKLLFEKISAVDICIHLAAVSDFIPAKSYNQKINSDENLELKLVRTKKLLDQIKKINKNCFLVGFKLETEEKEILEELKKTIIRSQSDMMVGNYQTKTTGTDGDSNEFWIMDKNFKTQKLDFGSKNDLAKKLVEIVFNNKL